MARNNIKKIVREQYGRVAIQGKGGCCHCNNSIFGEDQSLFHEPYSGQEGYVPDADHFLGCGIPFDHIRIAEGDHVVDLGSGAGNDCFIARHYTGTGGKVTGIDFTPEMIEKAKHNAQKLGFDNVEFIPGDLENLPLPSACADIAISNCVLNLVPDKQKALGEIFRILKPKGRTCISDMVVRGKLPPAVLNNTILYAGCISGASGRDEIIDMLCRAGFEDIRIRKETLQEIPDEIAEDIKQQNNSDDAFQGLYSITITAEKPGIVHCNNYNYNCEDF